MPVGVIIAASMLVISLVLATTMAIAWACFGRPKHALSWSIAYLLYGVEIICAAIGTAMPSLHRFTEPVSFLGVLLPAMLIAVGARQRAGLPSRWKNMGIAAAIIFMVTEAIQHLHPLPWLSAVDGLYTSTMLGIALAAIRPRNRATEPAELLIMIAICVFILFELTLVYTNMRSIALAGDESARTLFHTIYLAGLTPVFVATGISAILLVASDLALKLRTLAAFDPLTGILNRRGFDEAALRAVANGRRYRQPVAIAVVDIDHFKSINDRFGHTAGDRTLVFVSGQLGKGLREGDLVGRVGGEEFALLLINSTAEAAAEAIERIRGSISESFGNEGAPTPVTASFGIASVTMGPGTNEAALARAFEQADGALYRSKVGGRNRTTLAQDAA